MEELQNPIKPIQDKAQSSLNLSVSGEQSSDGKWNSGANFFHAGKPAEGGLSYNLSGGGTIGGNREDRKASTIGGNTRLDLNWQNDEGTKVSVGATADVSKTTGEKQALAKFGDVSLGNNGTSVTKKDFGIEANLQNQKGIGVKTAVNLGESSDGIKTQGYQIGANYQTPNSLEKPDQPTVNFGATFGQNTVKGPEGKTETQTLQATAGIRTETNSLNGTFTNQNTVTNGEKTQTTSIGAQAEHTTILKSGDNVGQILGCDFTNTQAGGSSSKTLGVNVGGSYDHQLENGNKLKTSLMASGSQTLSGPSIFSASATGSLGYETTRGNAVTAYYTKDLTGPKKKDMGTVGIAYQGSLSSLKKLW